MSGRMSLVNAKKNLTPLGNSIAAIVVSTFLVIALWVAAESKPLQEDWLPQPRSKWITSNQLRNLDWYPDKPQFSATLATNHYGEWVMPLMALPTNYAQFIMLGHCERSGKDLVPKPFEPKDRAFAAFMQSLNPRQNQVLCPFLKETYTSGQTLGYPQRRKCYIPSSKLQRISLCMLTKRLVKAFSSEQLMLAARTRLSIIDATSSERWKTLLKLKPQAIGLFIRRSEHAKNRNLSHELLKEQIVKFNSDGYQVVLMGDHPNDLCDQILTDSDGDYLDLTCKTIKAVDPDASIGVQFFILRELFLRGVRKVVGLWSGWLISSLLLGFRIEVLPSHIPDKSRIKALFLAFQPAAVEYLYRKHSFLSY